MIQLMWDIGGMGATYTKQHKARVETDMTAQEGLIDGNLA
jgi:hypothetical protein|tara:strand:+ start:250 stop:369 length:120 start_codon:yes stop_codon:yes gene_type:complete